MAAAHATTNHHQVLRRVLGGWSAATVGPMFQTNISSRELDWVLRQALRRPLKSFTEDQPAVPQLIHALPLTVDMFHAVAEAASEWDLVAAVLHKWGSWVDDAVFDTAALLGVDRGFADERYLMELSHRMSPATLGEILARADVTSFQMHGLMVGLPPATSPDSLDVEVVSNAALRTNFDLGLCQTLWRRGYHLSDEAIRGFLSSDGHAAVAWFVADMAPTPELRREVIYRWFHEGVHSEAASSVAATPEAFEVWERSLRTGESAAKPSSLVAALLCSYHHDRECFQDAIRRYVRAVTEHCDDSYPHLRRVAKAPLLPEDVAVELGSQMEVDFVYCNRPLLADVLTIPLRDVRNRLRLLSAEEMTAVQYDLDQLAWLTQSTNPDPLVGLYSRVAVFGIRDGQIPPQEAPLRPLILETARELGVEVHPIPTRFDYPEVDRTPQPVWRALAAKLTEVCGTDVSRWALTFHLLGPGLGSLPDDFTGEDLVATVGS